MNWNFITKFFQNILNIERIYKDCDRALGLLQDYNKDPNSFNDEKKELMDEMVQEAESGAKRILNLKGEKSWPGVFREMHQNLANMYMEMGQYDEAREQCNEMSEYGEVGRMESDTILQEISDRESGKKEEAA